jgi:glycosyltransferase involved in cell wall biosynthesis
LQKILYLTYDGLTDPLGQSQVLPYLCGLSKNGYRFSIISFEKPKAYAANKSLIKEICETNSIRWYPQPYTKNPPVLSTLKDIYRLRKVFLDLHGKEKFDLVHCRSYLTSLIGVWAKRKFGTKFVFDMRGFWADERVEGGLWNLNNPVFKTIYRYFKRKEQQLFSEADYIISLTWSGADQIKSELMKDKAIAPIQVIPCCVDLSLFDTSKISAQEISEKRKELEIMRGATVLSYIGSVGTWYMLEEMLCFFKVWLVESPQSIFLFITVDDPSPIFESAEKVSLAKEKLKIVRGKRNEMPILTACSDYSIFFIKPSFSKQASSPTKQGEIMALGKPIVCNAKVGDTGFVIDKYNAGVVVHQFNEESYKEKIGELKRRIFDPSGIRKGAEEFYSLEKGISSYQEVYRRLL